MARTFLQTQKAHAPGRHQRTGQRADRRGYPDDGVPWGQGGWASGATPPPPPILVSLTPATGSAAAAGIPIAVTGTGFISTAVAYADGVALQTTFTSATALQTGFDPTVAATVQFTVKNTPTGAASNALPFTVAAEEDPGVVLEGTIDEVKAYVNGLANDDNRDNVIQALIDHERTHRNRASLVSWLDQQTGVE